LALSGADLAGKIGAIVPNWIIPGTKVPDRPVVAIDRVRFVGECVALVIAETQAMGHDAFGLIDVDYETFPAVIDEEAAIRDGAQRLHNNVPNNITTIYKIGGGDGNRRPPASGPLRRRSVDSRGPCIRHDHGRDVGINADQRTDDLVQRVFRNQPVV
jgi:hypothetical protein